MVSAAADAALSGPTTTARVPATARVRAATAWRPRNLVPRPAAAGDAAVRLCLLFTIPPRSDEMGIANRTRQGALSQPTSGKLPRDSAVSHPLLISETETFARERS